MSVPLSRLGKADRLVAGGAIVLLVSMFLFDWFGENVSGTLPGSNITALNNSSSGWETFTNSRWVWLLTVVVALASVVATTSAVRLPASLQPGAIVLLLGALSSVLILYRIVHHPVASEGFGGFHASSGIKFGIWFGLIAALAIAGGGFLQLRPGQTRSFSSLAEPIRAIVPLVARARAHIVALAMRARARAKADPAGDPSDQPAPAQDAFTGLTAARPSPPAAPHLKDEPPPAADDGG